MQEHGSRCYLVSFPDEKTCRGREYPRPRSLNPESIHDQKHYEKHKNAHLPSYESIYLQDSELNLPSFSHMVAHPNPPTRLDYIPGISW
jgi:hypothetical protein